MEVDVRVSKRSRSGQWQAKIAQLPSRAHCCAKVVVEVEKTIDEVTNQEKDKW